MTTSSQEPVGEPVDAAEQDPSVTPDPMVAEADARDAGAPHGETDEAQVGLGPTD